MRVVLAVGSRDAVSAAQLKALERVLEEECVLITGDAPGLDFVAYNQAKKRHYEAVSVHAFWEKYGAPAGPERNASLAFLAQLLSLLGCDVECHAFPSANSVGTWDTVNKLKGLGFEVSIHR